MRARDDRRIKRRDHLRHRIKFLGAWIGRGDDGSHPHWQRERPERVARMRRELAALEDEINSRGGSMFEKKQSDAIAAQWLVTRRLIVAGHVIDRGATLTDAEVDAMRNAAALKSAAFIVPAAPSSRPAPASLRGKPAPPPPGAPLVAYKTLNVNGHRIGRGTAITAELVGGEEPLRRLVLGDVVRAGSGRPFVAAKATSAPSPAPMLDPIDAFVAAMHRLTAAGANPAQALDRATAAAPGLFQQAQKAYADRAGPHAASKPVDGFIVELGRRLAAVTNREVAS
jgi:hypothetical protein